MSIDVQAAKAAFTARFSAPAEVVVRAPGRVNIIGEHTDYNHGFVLPMAIERETVILARPRPDALLNAYAANLDRHATARLAPANPRVRGGGGARNEAEPWLDYVVGVADELVKLGKTPQGADMMIQGDVPIGCGLSSSAALEMAALCLFEALGGFQLGGADAARLGQRVENDFLGLSTGIMDQFISRCGKAGHSLFLDCRSYAYELIPVAFAKAVFVIANTRCSRGLTTSKYNERVAECTQAVGVLREQAEERSESATHLRDFTVEHLDACKEKMPAAVFRRARHVITENARTRLACAAMRNGDAERLGALMNDSDQSLREDYEVTSFELDSMTAIARSLAGSYGARMTGAGFGGCTINLVAKDSVAPFTDGLMAQYRERTGIEGEIIISRPAQGAEILEGG